MSILCELGLARFEERWERILMHNVGIVFVPIRLAIAEARVREILRHIIAENPQNEEQRYEVWADCVRIWHGANLIDGVIKKLISDGVSAELRAALGN